jgi:hypothetical protein
MLNLSYDVPVKLFSSHLLITAIFLIVPDFKRLTNMFILNRGVEPVEFQPLFKKVWLERGVKVLRVIFILFICGKYLYGSYQVARVVGDQSIKSPLYGIWNVNEVLLDGQVQPKFEETRWKKVVFDTVGRTIIFLNDDTKKYYLVDYNLEKKSLLFKKGYDPNWQANFSFERPTFEQAKIEGKMDGHQIQVKLQKIDESKFLLNSRGFHWINEYPFNF